MDNIRSFQELGYTIVATPHSHHVNYKVYKIHGSGIDPSTIYYLDQKNRVTEEIEKAQVFAYGDVKWDCCSNWHFDEQDRVMIHGCCKDDLVNIGKVLATCWDWTAELIPEVWDG